jgi:DNA-binding PadR family transcriptional regulator
MAIAHVVLGLLADGERHGYDLKRQHDSRFPMARPIAPAQVYATLDRLLRDGFVTPRTPERAGGPDRTAYGLTGTGRAELERWLAEVEEPSPYVANPLAVKVTVALLVAGDHVAADHLRRQRAAHLARMRELTRIKNEPQTSLAGVLAADYALAHLDADLRWIDTALARVSALAQELQP